jgi:hypothetical protein
MHACTRNAGRGASAFHATERYGTPTAKKESGRRAARVPPSRIARVRVDESTWATFKAAIGDRSVAEVLGRYVEAEAARAQRRRMNEGNVTQRELVDALEQARVLTESLERMTSTRGTSGAAHLGA